VKFLLRILAAALLLTAVVSAQTPDPVGPPAAPVAPPQSGGGSGPSVSLNLSAGSTDPEGLGAALEIVLLMTVLSMAPAIVMTMSCFTRIVIVLSFLKRAMSMQELPPTTVVTGFALFMTIFLMEPVVTDIQEQAYDPYVAGEIEWDAAVDRAAGRMSEFMLRQTREDDLALLMEMSSTEPVATPQELPFTIVLPAFVLSEIKTAFQMGFILFLPFVVIDLVISAILVSMGMFTLPPIVVSTPLKLLLFILVGGWDLVVMSLAASFAA